MPPSDTLKYRISPHNAYIKICASYQIRPYDIPEILCRNKQVIFLIYDQQFPDPSGCVFSRRYDILSSDKGGIQWLIK